MSKLSVENYKEHNFSAVKKHGPLKNNAEPLADREFITDEKTAAVFKILESATDAFLGEHGLIKRSLKPV